MGYRIRETGEYLASNAALRTYFGKRLRKTTDINAAMLESLGVDSVLEGPQATGGDHYQYSVRQGIEEINGKWYTKYVLGPIFSDVTQEDGTVLTAAQQEAAYKANKDEEQAKSIRAERDKKLADCDWVTLKAVDASSDVLGIQLPQVWIDYRQALRDITEQPNFPWDVTWPDAP